MSNGDGEPRPVDTDQSLSDLVRSWLDDALASGVVVEPPHDALAHLSSDVRSFGAGDRTTGTAVLGDLSGHVELVPQFGTGVPAVLRWRVDSPYWGGSLVVDAETVDPTLDLYAGYPGLYTVRLEGEDEAGLRVELGQTVVSSPWFARVGVDGSFDTLVAATGMDRERLLRRTRTVADYLLHEANVRTVWPGQPFGETLPAQYDDPLPVISPFGDTRVVLGFTSPVVEFDGCVNHLLVDVTLKGSSTVDVGEAATGASLYVGDSQPIRDSPFETLFDALSARTDLQEELTARYLGLEVARHVFLGMGVDPADDDVAKLGNLMYPGLHRVDDQTYVEWFVLGIQIHTPAAFPADESFLDRVQASRERNDIVLERDSHGLPKPPHTGLDVLAGLFADTRQVVERVAPLPPPTTGDSTPNSAYRVIDNQPWVRTGPPTFSKVYVTDAAGDRSAKSLQKGQAVTIEETDADERYVRVAALDGTDLGWTARSNLSRPYKDDSRLERVDLAPQTSVTIDPDWSRKKRRLAETYNRLGGLMETLSEAAGIEVAGALAVWYIESAGREHTVDDAIIRFENHKFWSLWGNEHTDRFDDHFQFCSRSPVTLGTTQCAETCGTTAKGYPRRYRCHRYRVDASDTWTCLHTPSQGKNAREYEALGRAEALSTDDTARRCISMGGPQIMGDNYWLLGYESPSAMYDAFQASERAHVLGFFDFCKHNRGGKAIEYLQQSKWAAFAGIYNGHGKEKLYGDKIEEMYDLATAFLSP